MSSVRSISTNMMLLTLGELISKLLQFLVMVYAARLLDPASFGKFSFALSLSFIAIIAADLGINQLLIREIARNKRDVNKYFINAVVVKAVFSLIAYIFIIILLNVLDYPKDTRYVVYAVWIFTIISNFTDLFYSVFRAFEKMKYDSIIKVLRMLLLAPIGWIVLNKGYGVLAFSIVFVVVEMIILLVAYIMASSRNFIKLTFDIRLDFMKSLVKTSLPLGMAFVFSSIYFFIDSVMLSKMRGDVEVAVYSVAYNLALALLFIPAVYTNAIYPVMSVYFKTSRQNLVFLYERSFKYLYIIGLPISAGLYVLADRIILFFYGKAYLESVIALQVIAWFLFIKFLNYLMSYALSSVDQQHSRMVGQGLTAAFNVVLNLILIPRFGYVGAAVSTFFTEIFLFGLYYWYVSRSLRPYNFLPILARPAIASAAMAAFIYYFSPMANLSLLVLLSAAVYFAAIFILRVFDDDDYRIFRKIINRNS